MSSVVISGTGLFTPPEVISNEELVASFNAYAANFNRAHQNEIASGALAPLAESSADFIVKASGIERRHVLEKVGTLDPDIMCPRIPERSNDEPSLQCEMAVLSAREALAEAKKSAGDIDAVIVACSNMQRAYPAIAIEVQAALGIGGYAFDLNVACSSATFGIRAANDAILSGGARAVLVVNPEICTGHLNFRDRDSHFIFGDACTAVVLERAETCSADQPFALLGSKLRTQFSNNIRNNFGFMNRSAPHGVNATDKLFVQHGRKVYKDVVPMVGNLILEHLAQLGIAPANIRRLWLHQANLSMNQAIARRVLGRDASEKEAPTILNEYANTSSAGSIIAFHKYKADLAPGNLGIICSFGAGYSVGSLVVEKSSPLS